MKRIILLMAAIVCLATSAMAEVTDDQALSPALWQQGVARCAQYTAYDKGFAKGDDYMKGKYPDGYTLEDLNALYGYHQKWAEIYKQFKPFENKGGSQHSASVDVGPWPDHRPYRDKLAKKFEKEREQLIESLTKEMKAAAKILEFEAAAKLRDRIRQLREQEK